MSRTIESVDVSLDELVAEAKRTDKLVFCDSKVMSRNFPEPGAASGLVLLHPRELGLASYFSTEQAEAAISAAHHRAGTMWELVHYVTNGWDRAARVAALGSIWQSSDGKRFAGYLNAIPHIPRLNLANLDYDWDHLDSFLAVAQ
jgi:hypothetical protein